LTNAKHVTIHEADIRIGVTIDGFGNRNLLVLSQHLVAILHDVPGQIR
jgi:hypothetical protein